jgi:hypothetical protein
MDADLQMLQIQRPHEPLKTTDDPRDWYPRRPEAQLRERGRQILQHIIFMYEWRCVGRTPFDRHKRDQRMERTGIAPYVGRTPRPLYGKIVRGELHLDDVDLDAQRGMHGGWRRGGKTDEPLEELVLEKRNAHFYISQVRACARVRARRDVRRGQDMRRHTMLLQPQIIFG